MDRIYNGIQCLNDYGSLLLSLFLAGPEFDLRQSFCKERSPAGTSKISLPLSH